VANMQAAPSIACKLAFKWFSLPALSRNLNHVAQLNLRIWMKTRAVAIMHTAVAQLKLSPIAQSATPRQRWETHSRYEYGIFSKCQTYYTTSIRLSPPAPPQERTTRVAYVYTRHTDTHPKRKEYQHTIIRKIWSLNAGCFSSYSKNPA